jgi:hypothetical protein
MARQPSHHTGIRLGARRLAQNVGVNQDCHSVSVDSDSIGTKKPFSGQARSHSRTP